MNASFADHKWLLAPQWGPVTETGISTDDDRVVPLVLPPQWGPVTETGISVSIDSGRHTGVRPPQWGPVTETGIRTAPGALPRRRTCLNGVRSRRPESVRGQRVGDHHVVASMGSGHGDRNQRMGCDADQGRAVVASMGSGHGDRNQPGTAGTRPAPRARRLNGVRSRRPESVAGIAQSTERVGASMGSGHGDRNQIRTAARPVEADLPQWGPVTETGISGRTRMRRVSWVVVASMGSGHGDRNQVGLAVVNPTGMFLPQWGPVTETGIRRSRGWWQAPRVPGLNGVRSRRPESALAADAHRHHHAASMGSGHGDRNQRRHAPLPPLPVDASMGSGHGDRNQASGRSEEGSYVGVSMGSGHGDRNQLRRELRAAAVPIQPQWGPVTETGIRARGERAL